MENSFLEKYLKSEKVLFLIFILLSFSTYLFLSCIVPFAGAPDEVMRYQIPEFIYKYGSLPNGWDEAIRNPLWGISYGFTPILSYIFSAGLMKVTSIFTTSEEALLFSARFISVLSATFAIFFLILTVQTIMRKSYAKKWLTLCLFAFLPSFIAVSAYVNVDAFAVLTTAVVIYSWALGIKTQWNYKSCIIMAVGLAGILMSYYNAYGFVPCSIFVFFMTMIFAFDKKATENGIIKKTALIVGITFLLSGWWFIRNAMLYDGDFLGLQTCNDCGEIYAQEGYKPSQLDCPQNLGQSLWYLLTDRLWCVYVLRSFIGTFGKNDIMLEMKVYLFYAFIFLVGIVGCFLSVKKFFPGFKEKRNCQKTLFNITMIIAMVIPFAINLYYSYTSDYQPQGRYSLPALIPFAYFIASGVNNLLVKITKSEKVQNIATFSVAVLIIAFTIYIFAKTLIPIYMHS